MHSLSFSLYNTHTHTNKGYKGGLKAYTQFCSCALMHALTLLLPVKHTHTHKQRVQRWSEGVHTVLQLCPDACTHSPSPLTTHTHTHTHTHTKSTKVVRGVHTVLQLCPDACAHSPSPCKTHTHTHTNKGYKGGLKAYTQFCSCALMHALTLLLPVQHTHTHT